MHGLLHGQFQYMLVLTTLDQNNRRDQALACIAQGRLSIAQGNVLHLREKGVAHSLDKPLPACPVHSLALQPVGLSDPAQLLLLEEWLWQHRCYQGRLMRSLFVAMGWVLQPGMRITESPGAE